MLAERFDADPFLIFTWRGWTKDELLAGLRARRAKGKRLPGSAAAVAARDGERSFWRSGAELSELRINPLAGEVSDALVRRLGPAPSEVGRPDLADALAAMYMQLADAAERRALSA